MSTPWLKVTELPDRLIVIRDGSSPHGPKVPTRRVRPHYMLGPSGWAHDDEIRRLHPVHVVPEPGVLAKVAATVDIVSGGRTEMVIGGGGTNRGRLRLR